MPNQHSPLKNETLAQLFLQLAQLESAGMPVEQALSLLDRKDSALNAGLLVMRRLVQTGHGIAESGLKAGIFDENLHAVISAAENGGQLAATYKKLAGYYLGRHQRLTKIRSRLVFPGFILVLGLLTQPLPSLVAGNISAGQYILQVFGVLFAIAGSIFLFFRLPESLAQRGLKPAFDTLLWQLPVVRNWLTRRQLNDFFFMLGILLEAGLPFSESLPRAVAIINNSVLQQQFSSALAMCHSGISVANLLSGVSALKPTTLQIIKSGEQSGKLAQTLLHFNRIEAETIALQDEALAEWLPRVVYAIIAGWMAYSILTSGAFLPHVE